MHWARTQEPGASHTLQGRLRGETQAARELTLSHARAQARIGSESVVCLIFPGCPNSAQLQRIQCVSLAADQFGAREGMRTVRRTVTKAEAFHLMAFPSGVGGRFVTHPHAISFAQPSSLPAASPQNKSRVVALAVGHLQGKCVRARREARGAQVVYPSAIRVAEQNAAVVGLSGAMFTKCIVVVDHDVDVHNLREVTWKAFNHIDPERDIQFTLGPVDQLEHASRLPNFGSKMGVDATHKWPSEGFTRPWPDEITMDPEVKKKIDTLWTSLGLGARG